MLNFRNAFINTLSLLSVTAWQLGCAGQATTLKRWNEMPKLCRALTAREAGGAAGWLDAQASVLKLLESQDSAECN